MRESKLQSETVGKINSLSSLSGDQLLELRQSKLESEEPSILSKVGSAIDSVTGAPTRSAIGAAQSGKNPITAFANQFSEDPNQAPTGKDIVVKAGVPDRRITLGIKERSGEGELPLPNGMGTLPSFDEDINLNPADTLGLATEFAADPLILGPGILSLLGKTSAGAKTAKGVKEISKLVGKGAKKASDSVGRQVTKTASNLTGVTEKEIQTFAKNHKEVNKIIKKFGGDISEAADASRRNTQARLRSTRATEGNKIGQAIEKASKTKDIDVSSVVKKLAEHKKRLDPVLDEKDLGQIDDLIETVNKFSPDNKVNLEGLNRIKRKLQEVGSPSFNDTAAGFAKGKQAQQASKSASGQAREILDSLSEPIRQANSKLSKIRRIEKLANKNLIVEGKTESALLAAGRGSNKRNAAVLRKIGKLTGSDPLKEAELLATAKTFSEAGAVSKLPTGKALKGIVTGSALGGAPGALVGAILSSPLALKKAIELGVITKNVIEKGGKISKSTSEILLKNLAKTAAGRRVLQDAEKQIKSGKKSPFLPTKVAPEETAIKRRLKK